ncbi:MAG: class I SAM-dependent methyltransferase [Gemmatimonadaceae bacterium]
MNRASHWEHIYGTKAPDEVSWFQPEPTLSLELIQHAAPTLDASIIDIGAGASTLVDALLYAGYHRITVLEISAAALDRTRHRLHGAFSDGLPSVIWLNDDILTVELPAGAFDVWHDRAVFHFLTDAADRALYLHKVRHALKPGGYAVIATFAEDGPTKCSGLDVVRYSPNDLSAEFGREFKLEESRREEHRTPWGATQSFNYCLLRYNPQQ